MLSNKAGEEQPPKPKKPEDKPTGPMEPRVKRAEPMKLEAKQTELMKQDALLDQKLLRGKSKEELIRLVFEVARELKTRVEAETNQVAPADAAVSFRTVLDTDVEEFIRMPAVSSKEPEEAAETTWRVILTSSDTTHRLIGLEVYDDVIVGRMAESAKRDLDLTEFGAEELGVSRRHALLSPTKHNLLLIDLGSTNGTFHNAERIRPGVPKELRNNDTISLGRLHFKVRIVGQPAKTAN
jgi:hypothetical protein